MSLVLDTGALIAFDRGDRQVAALIEAARRRGDRVLSSSGCVGQSWRDGARQARLARLLAGVDERPLDPGTSRAVGELCARGRLNDVVDAHVALVTHDGDVVLTSDQPDLKRLLRAHGVSADVIPC
jgi:uncharacterized protein (DUF58 family)